MDGPFLAVTLILLLFLPFHLLVCWQLWKMSAPARGERVECRDVQARGDVIGRYADAEIHAWVQAGGSRYRFDRVQSAPVRQAEHELVVPPGVVYVRAREPS